MKENSIGYKESTDLPLKIQSETDSVSHFNPDYAIEKMSYYS